MDLDEYREALRAHLKQPISAEQFEELIDACVDASAAGFLEEVDLAVGAAGKCPECEIVYYGEHAC